MNKNGEPFESPHFASAIPMYDAQAITDWKNGYDTHTNELYANVFDSVKNATGKIWNKAKGVVENIADEAINTAVNTYETVTSRVVWENLLSAQEQGVSVKNIANGYLLSQDADDRAYEYAEKNSPNRTEDNVLITWGNEADAYRHFTWNYEMASKFGYSDALKISSAHEIAYLRLNNLVFYTNTGDVYDRKAFMTPQMLMDVWNNLKGVNAYSEFNDEDYDYEKAYETMTKRNDLVNNEEDALKVYGFTQNDITTKNVGDETLRGVWVYFNYKNGYITNIRKAEN